MITAKRRTIGRSFRLDERWLNVLNEEAKRERISPNALLNRILEDYSLYHRHFARYSCMSMTKTTFSTIMKKYPNDEIDKLAEESVQIITKDLFPALGRSFNYDTVIFFISHILGKYGNWFKYEHHHKNNKEIFHLRHTLDDNTSKYLVKLLSKLFEALDKKVNIDTYQGSITLELLQS